MDSRIVIFLTWYIALIVAMVIHEAAHAWVAYLGGDRTAYETGQVTVNPIPHMQREPFGTIVLPILTFFVFRFPFPLGFAHAPYDPYWAEAHPKRAAIMSAAGPISNLLLAAVLWGVMKLGLSMEWFEVPLRWSYDQIVAAEGWAEEGFLAAAARICSVFFFINLLLGIFNLIPVHPLDGAGIAEGLLPPPLSNVFRFMRTMPMFAIVGLMLAWYLAWDVIEPVFRGAVNLLFR